MIRLRRYSLALPLIFLAAAPQNAQDRRPITEMDLFKFMWAADPQISPNGSQVLFVRVNVNEDKDRYETQIYVIGRRSGALCGAAAMKRKGSARVKRRRRVIRLTSGWCSGGDLSLKATLRVLLARCSREY